MSPTSRQQVVSQIERLGACATVRTADRESAAQAAEAAVRRGFRMVESTLTAPGALAAAVALDTVSIPGTHTPTEMLAAHRAGADVVKLFPAPAAITFGFSRPRPDAVGYSRMPSVS